MNAIFGTAEWTLANVTVDETVKNILCNFNLHETVICDDRYAAWADNVVKQLTEEKILPLPEIIFHFAIKKIMFTLVFLAGKME